VQHHHHHHLTTRNTEVYIVYLFFLPADTNIAAPISMTIKISEVVFPVLAGGTAVMMAAVVYAVKKHSQPHHEDTEYLRTMKVPSDSLFSIFQPHLVPMQVIRSRGYSSVLSLVQHMIGVQPTCDMVLEIWPPCFECYNIIVPNFLNFPQSLLGAPGAVNARLISLAMYASSRANQCAYCTSHCCSFAVRRGVDPAIFRTMLEELDASNKDNAKTTQQKIVLKLAYGLGTVPCTLTQQDVSEAFQVFSRSKIEWMVAATAMFGSFNKLMDGLDIPLEADTYQETADLMDTQFQVGDAAGAMLHSHQRMPPPAKDSWTDYLDILFQGLRPGGALALNETLLKGIPTKANDCCAYLEKVCGCSFRDVLQPLEQDRFRRALTGVVAKNFTSANLTLHLKVHVGLQYCEILENSFLAQELECVLQFTQQSSNDDIHESDFAKLVMQVGKALSYTPSRMTGSLVERIRQSQDLTPVKIIELVSFLATLQMMHRIVSYQIVANRIHGDK
jgi:alkylhydroperoxidase family enzyme